MLFARSEKGQVVETLAVVIMIAVVITAVTVGFDTALLILGK